MILLFNFNADKSNHNHIFIMNKFSVFLLGGLIGFLVGYYVKNPFSASDLKVTIFNDDSASVEEPLINDEAHDFVAADTSSCQEYGADSIVFDSICSMPIKDVNKSNGNGNLIYLDKAKPMSSSTNIFKVSAVLDNHQAIAREVQSFGDGMYLENDLRVLMVNDKGDYYYDGQIIRLSSGKRLWQLGVFKYNGQTLPIVEIK